MQIIQGQMVAPKKKIGIVASRFNEDITETLLANALQRCEELAIKEEQLIKVRVPGAVEIPVISSLLAKREDVAAIVCLGAIIKGETAHFEYVSKVCMEGCNQVMLKHDVPVIMGVITAYTRAQALARTNGEVLNMGREMINIACEMSSTCEQLRNFI